MKQKLLILGLCVCFLVTGCGTIPTLENGEEIVASIDGKNFTANDLYAKLKLQGGRSVLLELIDDYIASQEIPDDTEAKEYAKDYLSQLKTYYNQLGQDFDSLLTSSGYSSEDEFLKLVIKDYKKQQVAEKYLMSQISDDELNAYYDNEIFGAITVRHILIMPKTTDDMTDEEIAEAEKVALNEAKEIIKKLDNGESIEDLAAEYSDDDGTKDNGGLFENFTKDGVDTDFFKASNEMNVDTYSKTPVKSSYGYHIIYKVKQDDKPALEEVEEDIKESIIASKMQSDSSIVSNTWIEIRKAYNLSIIDTDIKKSYEDSIS